MSNDVLIVSMTDGVENCRELIAQQIGQRVEVAADPRAALLALRRKEFGVIVVDEGLAEVDPEWTDEMWSGAGRAMLILVNFGIKGCARLGREVRAALLRRQGDQAVARKAAVQEIELELKTTVTGLLLESELALREEPGSTTLEPKLRHLVELAGHLRDRLNGVQDKAA